MEIPKSGHFNAFSVIVDINGFTRLVDEYDGGLDIATFVRDVLVGAIHAIEDAGGNVIGIMGDAVFGILPTAESVIAACCGIAKDLDNLCNYLEGTEFQAAIPDLPSIKIGVEYGTLASSTIQTNALGALPFCIGPATNYAARILGAGTGNRCHIGPRAFEKGLSDWVNSSESCEVTGKKGEAPYQYWILDLSDIWEEGEQEKAD